MLSSFVSMLHARSVFLFLRNLNTRQPQISGTDSEWIDPAPVGWTLLVYSLLFRESRQEHRIHVIHLFET